MKKYILYCLLLKFTVVSAQEHEENLLIRYNVQYNHLFDRGSDIKTYDAKLYVQGDRSLFTMKRNKKNESLDIDNYYDASPDSLFTVYKDVESNSLLFDFYALDQQTHFYADTLHPMEWKLTSEEKIVEGISCKKAVTRFKGRDYVAWYAPSIPISNGPWKLGGLPGLILEAYDDHREWVVACSGLDKLNFYDFGAYQQMVNRGVDEYAVFINELKQYLKKLSGSLSAQGSSDCFTCEQKSLVKLYVWEKFD